MKQKIKHKKKSKSKGTKVKGIGKCTVRLLYALCSFDMLIYKVLDKAHTSVCIVH